MRIVAAKKPAVIFLENVKNLVRHDQGKAFAVIKKTIADLGYSFSYAVINAQATVPQKRIRCYMVCLRDTDKKFEFPEFLGEPIPLKSIN